MSQCALGAKSTRGLPPGAHDLVVLSPLPSGTPDRAVGDPEQLLLEICASTSARAFSSALASPRALELLALLGELGRLLVGLGHGVRGGVARRGLGLALEDGLPPLLDELRHGLELGGPRGVPPYEGGADFVEAIGDVTGVEHAPLSPERLRGSRRPRRAGAARPDGLRQSMVGEHAPMQSRQPGHELVAQSSQIELGGQGGEPGPHRCAHRPTEKMQTSWPALEPQSA
jgi:hypothetical protein